MTYDEACELYRIEEADRADVLRVMNLVGRMNHVREDMQCGPVGGDWKASNTIHEYWEAKLAALAPAPDAKADERKFPIQSERGAKPHLHLIPWSVAEQAYSVYSSRYGRGQTLERLAERGGFGPSEMDDFVPDWRERCDEIVRLRALVSSLQSQLAECKQRETALVADMNFHGCPLPPWIDESQLASRTRANEGTP